MASSDSTSKPIRIWTDGCFDMMHFGHANALRQVRPSYDLPRIDPALIPWDLGFTHPYHHLLFSKDVN
jgi:hypothetical protein